MPPAEPAVAKTEKQVDPKSLTRLLAGMFLQMVDERWFYASPSDINRKLNRKVSKIGLLLEDVSYDDAEGIEDKSCKTFTLRQFYQDGSPSLDFSEVEVDQMLDGWERHIDRESRLKIERVLRPGLDEFRSNFTDYNREAGARREQKAEVLRKERESIYVPQSTLV